MDHWKEVLNFFLMRKAPIVAAVLSVLFGAFPVFAASPLTTYINSQSNVIDYVDDTDTGVAGSPIGVSGTSNSQISFRYVPGSSHNICSVSFITWASGTPTDSLALAVSLWGPAANNQFPVAQADIASQGTQLAGPTTSWQIRGSTPRVTTYTFTPCLVTVGANAYQFTLYRTGSLDNTNYYNYGATGVSSGDYTQSGSWDITKQYTLRGWSSTGVLNSYPAEGVFALVAFQGSENFGATAPSTTPSFAQSVLNTITGVNDDNATSTLTTSVGGWANIPAFFAQKVPWGYAFDIAEVYDNVSTSTSDFSAIVFDFTDTRISTGTRAWLPGRITVFSTSTVTTYLSEDALNALNTLAAAAGWIGAAMYWFRRAVKT